MYEALLQISFWCSCDPLPEKADSRWMKLAKHQRRFLTGLAGAKSEYARGQFQFTSGISKFYMIWMNGFAHRFTKTRTYVWQAWCRGV